MASGDTRAIPQPDTGLDTSDEAPFGADRTTLDGVRTLLTSPAKLGPEAAPDGDRSRPLPAPWRPRAGAEIAGRYVLGELLGRGGHGEAWTASDRVLRATVAVKWLYDPGVLRSSRARREIALLRTLRMPGVVRFLDEGVSNGCSFVVTEVAAGAPFPGALPPGEQGGSPWERIAPAVLSLLEILARVHARGVVHLDLKPANVMVDAEGRATLLDFGISQWSETDPQGQKGIVVGTPAYMAPEQCAGEAVDGRADLYAVGVMAFDASTGRLPTEGEAPRDGSSPLGLPETVPGAAAAAIERLLARHPADRFRSAEEAIAAIAESSPGRGARPASRTRRRERAAPRTERSLRGLFAGPDRIFHLREDAARQLWERTGGAPERVETELDAWVRLGVARRTEEGFAVDPSGLVRLRYLPPAASVPGAPLPDGALARDLKEAQAWLSLAVRPVSARTLADAMGVSEEDASARCAGLVSAGRARRRGDRFEMIVPADLEEASHDRAAWHRGLADAMERGEDGRLYHLIAASELPAAAAEAAALSRRLAVEGDLAGARAAVGEGLSALRLCPWERPQLEAALLTELTKVALAEATPTGFDLTLYELSRASHRGSLVEALEALVRAAVRAPSALPAEEILRLPSFDDGELLRRRNHLRVVACSARTDTEGMAAALKETERWAEASNQKLARLCLAEGTAVRCYLEGDFEGAAAAYLAAAELDPWATDKLDAMVGSALSLLEAFRHREAERRGRQARKLAARHRHFYSEARAEWLVRAARYRAGERLRPDHALVRAVERIGAPNLHATVCLQESAVAFRAEAPGAARELSAAACRIWSEMNRKWSVLLVRSLGIRAGAPAAEQEILTLAREALVCPIPGVGIQALGLLAAVEVRIGPRFAEAVPALIAPIAPRHRGLRMDVLSADEAVAALHLRQERR